MKKLYTFLCAVAVTALTAGAATPQLQRAATFERQAAREFVPQHRVAKACAAIEVEPVIATAAAQEYPADLKDKKFLINYVVELGQSIPSMDEVSFEYVQDQDGVQVYLMHGFMANFWKPEMITMNDDLVVAYMPTAGRLMLLGDQTVMTLHDTDQATGSTTDTEYQLWTEDTNDSGSWYNANMFFDYKDGEFVFVDTVSTTFEGDNEPTELKWGQCATGRVVDNQLDLLVSWTFGNISMCNATMKYTMTNNSGAQEFPLDLFTKLTDESKTLMVYGFAGMVDVPMTVDKDAKTLTATNVSFGKLALDENQTIIVDLMLSAANGTTAQNTTNAAGKGKYELVSTYEVKDGKTVITVPNWNGFYIYQNTEDFYFWPMSATTITLDYDLDAKVAGVKDIIAGEAVDADAPVEYYNLQGVRVAEPAAGLYIRRQGKTVSKVVIR